ncbi:MAG: iron-only hydrogenase system regulator [Peptostreptococcus sp.]|uniref:TM1266 family iron-only hydrogenase system putative regulator n=1 Tax=Peptostreptococcus sp. TaxID=1262 RepID=UPI002FCB916A
MNKRVAVISAILESPLASQSDFNSIISDYKGIVRGRMGIPFEKEGISVVSITVLGTLDDINGLTGKLGKIEHVTVKTAISKKEVICP